MPTLATRLVYPSYLPRPNARRSGAGDSVNDWLNSAVQWVQQQSAAGSEGVGDVSNALLQAGFTLSQISAILGGVAESPITTEQTIAQMQAEYAYIEEQKRKQSQTLLFFGLLAAVAILAMKDN